MSSPRLHRFVALLGLLACYWQAAGGSYYPVYGQGAGVFYNGQLRVDSEEQFVSLLDAVYCGVHRQIVRKNAPHNEHFVRTFSGRRWIVNVCVCARSR